MPKILVIEDDINISNMLCDLLKQNGYEPVAAYSGTEGVMCFENNQFELVLLDLMLPGKTGQEVLKELKEISNTPIIAVTAVNNKEVTVSLLKLGADDYMTKPFDNDELLARIEVQLRRAQMNDGTCTCLTFKDIRLDLETYEVKICNETVLLSKREFEILKLMMTNPKKVFTKNNLYETIWKDEFFGDDNTINVHISKIRGKLAQVAQNHEYIQTVWGIGFKMKE